MFKKLVIAAVLLSLAAPAWGAAAQDNPPLVVWQALSADDSGALQAAAQPFVETRGLTLELQYVDASYLSDEMIAAQQGGALPDAVLVSSELIAPLSEGGLIAPLNERGDLFLTDLLANLPGLLGVFCGETEMTSCLWPDQPPTLPLPGLDETTLARTAEWLCRSAPWMPSCSGDPLAGLPLSWNFQVYLISGDWLAENGLKAPATVQDLADMRAKFRLTFVYADPDFMPMADEIKPSSIYVIDSRLLAEHADALMRSMGSFQQAAYVPVLLLTVDSAYVVAGTRHAAQAEGLVRDLTESRDLKVELFHISQRLPAVDAAGLSARRMDADAARATLQALVVLVAYARLAY